MKILSLECSATPCSVALFEDGKLLASAFSNVKLTHSQTLMPMVESVLKSAFTDLTQVDAFAVSAGPGSFTGVRIGISAVKGMAQAKNKPCYGVSTLEAMAHNYGDSDCVICAVMDARCNQFYNALFANKNGEITRLCEDRAIGMDCLKEEIEKFSKENVKIFIVGDGAELFYNAVADIENVALADAQHRFQNAVGVSAAIKTENYVSAAELQPVYLRLPQAERELKRKKEQDL